MVRGCEGDLAVLVVPQAGDLCETGDPWEPFRLHDPGGEVVSPVAEFLTDLQAAGRPATTQRSHAMDLLRWFRFCWAVGVPWNLETRAEARDFSRVSHRQPGKPAPPGCLAPGNGLS